MDLLTLDAIGLRADGPTLTLTVRAGEAIAIMGRAGSGRSSLLRVCAGREKPTQGRVTLGGECVLSGDGLGRRSRVQSVAKATGHPKATEWLAVLGLGDARNEVVPELTPGLRAAIEIVPPLLSGAPILALDGQLDRLDPWAYTMVWDALNEARREGAALVIVTDRPETAAQCDAVVVLRDRTVRFAGGVEALRRLGPPHAMTVTTEHQAAVRALVAPFEVAIESTPEGLRLEAKDGQELAARLLREGYGDVRYVVSRPPTLEEGLQTL